MEISGITRNITITPKRNWIINGLLLISFTVICLINIAISKEIAFRLSWDIMVFRSGAYKISAQQSMGYEYYFSMFSNNIPITYILGRLHRWCTELENYPYSEEFIWTQINCNLISISGFFSCLTVKKLTQRIAPVLLTFVTFFVLIAMSAWKIAPYTDTYGMPFPIMCIFSTSAIEMLPIHTKRQFTCCFLSPAAWQEVF